MSQLCRVTVMLCRSVIMSQSLCHCHVISQCYYVTVMLCHRDILSHSLCHSHHVQPHYVCQNILHSYYIRVILFYNHIMPQMYYITFILSHSYIMSHYVISQSYYVMVIVIIEVISIFFIRFQLVKTFVNLFSLSINVLFLFTVVFSPDCKIASCYQIR